MNSPGGFARTPAHLDRDESISPLPLDLSTETSTPFSPEPDHPVQGLVQRKHRPSSVSSFSKFPSNVLQRILWAVDAHDFASLCVVNRKWRLASENVELYAYHLSRCPSFALSNSIISGPFRRNDLSRLKAKFAAEVRRNLFSAYLQPRRTLINLISVSANSSAAFPTGEAFRFEFSPNARTILALSSSRIYVLDATADPPIVTRHLKTLRRPLSASITDDGSLLAVLSTKHQVNVYALTSQSVQHLQVIALDNPPRIIAIAPEGTVLAASYETAIEVFSLAANSMTTDRRAVRSEAVHSLDFSGDGSMLVGSSLSLEDPNAVVISAPFYTENDPDLSAREIHSRMWTTQILFPQITSVCSHVRLLPGHLEGDACWLFAFDHSLMSYRAVRTDDTRAGVAYFRSPPGADRFDTLTPTISPSASACGTLAVAAFEGDDGLWLYGIPERLDVCPDMSAVVERENERQIRSGLPLTSATGMMEPLMAYSPSISTTDHFIEDDQLASKVDWRQSLFVKCQNINGLPGQTAARWVEYKDNTDVQSKKRLVIVAPGGVAMEEDEFGDEGMPVDGSRMCLLDFDYAPSTLQDRTLTIEVDEREPELLTEHTGSLAAEVAMERRRTIRAIPSSEATRVPLGRSATSISPVSGTLLEDRVRPGSISTPSSPIEQTRSSQIHPANGLHRSATASGFRHARYPPRPPLGSAQYASQSYSAYTRAGPGGPPISETSWETPPPPYAGRNTSQFPSTTSGVISIVQPTQPSISPPPESDQILQTPLQYRPYRALVAERRSATLDAIMSSNALPSGAGISQHEELALAARSRGPSEESLAAVNEAPWSLSNLPDIEQGSRSPRGLDFGTDVHRRARPVTLYSNTPQSWQAPSISNIGPATTSSSGGAESVPPISTMRGSSSLSGPGGPSLVGINSTNRLNHTVPSVREVPQPFAGAAHNGTQRLYAQPSDGHVYPSMPTPDQLANLNQRTGAMEAQRPPGTKNTNFIRKVPVPSSVPGVSASPPRAAWGAAGVPGSPSVNQARHIPNGFVRSRSSSKGSQASNLASASAPNLLAQRPKYGRLDTIDSIHNVPRSGENDPASRMRAHSLSQPGMAAPAEPSAYHETSRSVPGLLGGKHGKKPKKRKDESTKKGSRCTVM